MEIFPEPEPQFQTPSQSQNVNQFTRKQQAHNLLILGIILLLLVSVVSYNLGIQRNHISLNDNVSYPPLPRSPVKNINNNPNPTSITSTTSPVLSWKIYEDEDLVFQYPSDWTPTQMTFSRDSYRKGKGLPAVYDINKIYSLSVTKHKNSEPGTGKIFVNLEDYLNLKKSAKKVVVSGQIGVQVFPREDAQNLNKVVFFSEDKENIYDIQMTTFVRDEATIAQGQQIFNTILSNFTIR